MAVWFPNQSNAQVLKHITVCPMSEAYLALLKEKYGGKWTSPTFFRIVGGSESWVKLYGSDS